LWTHDEAAKFLNISPWTLHYLCINDRGPRRFKVGKHRRYHPDDVQAWLVANELAGNPVNRRGIAI
jgi:excisionase family DNA binding protein